MSYEGAPIPDRYVVPDPIKTNVLAIISLVSAFVVPVAGIVLGHLALSQIRRTGEAGRGLAQGGLIVGYMFTGLIILFVLCFFSVWLAAMLSIFSAVNLTAS